eukprot:NODE_266_length_11332_cov_0.554705.p6 type:complete len:244 gc:universal NODE_266_length_11332_cov_0.554705:9005-9736(+)
MDKIASYHDYLKTLPPPKQLQFVKAKTAIFNRQITHNLDVRNINEYNRRICDPMTSHPNISREEIDLAFSQSQGDIHLIDSSTFIDIIKHLPKRKCHGIKDIPNESIIYGGTFLHEQLLKILQIMINTGYVPTQMGISTLIPIPKVISPSSITEFRPISLLLTIRKIFECYLNFAIKIKLPHNQFGFQRNSSIHDAVMHLQRLIKSKSRINQPIQYICLLDVKKAYDSLDRKSLLNLFGDCSG